MARRPKRPASRDDPAAPRAQPHGPYWTGAHTTHRLRYHLVFIPKYRRRVLGGPVAARLAELIAHACAVHRWQAHELSVQRDHVHLLLQVGPDDSVASVMQALKGGTAHALRAEFPELDEFLWGASFWADGYFAETVGQVQEDVIRRYIQRQGLRPQGQERPP